MAIHIKILQKKASLCVRLFFVLFLFAQDGISQTKNTDHHEAAFSYYLNLQFDSCTYQLELIDDKPYSIYLESLIETTKIFLSDDIDVYKSNKGLESELLKKVDQILLPEQERRFIQSEIKIQWAILKMKYGDEFSAFWNLRQAYLQTQKNITNHPEFLHSHKTMGMLQILFGIVPEKYSWVLNLFGIEGDVEAGLQSLQKITNSNSEYNLESRILTALLQTYLLSQPDQGFETIKDIQIGQRQLLTVYTYCLIAMKNAQSELALAEIESSKNHNYQPFRLPQLYYVLAEIYLQKGEWEKAISNYQLFIQYHSGLSLIKDSYYKIGICYLIEEKSGLAQISFKSATENGWTKNEADNYAQSQIDKADFSHKNLYQLRYATDGGYYKSALKLQSELKELDLQGRNLCEFYYRSARLEQKISNLEKAINHYQKTIEAQKDAPWYFAPNAALQLGMIYKKKNDIQNSEKYLELVFDYKNHPYQKSIRQKAKTLRKSLD